MNNIKYLYGLPVYIENIKNKLYKRLEIISQIEKNYNISSIRDNWSKNSFIKTDIHHSLQDEKNNKFYEICYYDLKNIYKEIIINYLKKLNLKKSVKFTFDIVNYTCSKHNSFMTPHIHTNCHFSLIHYINFDEKEHLPTIFKSPYFFGNILPSDEKFCNIFSNKVIENSWMQKEWILNIVEEDVVIVPSMLEHYVRNLDSKKLRITIAANIKIEE